MLPRPASVIGPTRHESVSWEIGEMRMRQSALLICVWLLAAPVVGEPQTAKDQAATTRPAHAMRSAATAPDRDQVREAVGRGVAYLLKDQNRNGSWGGPQDSVTTWSGPVWPYPETCMMTSLGFLSRMRSSVNPSFS